MSGLPSAEMAELLLLLELDEHDVHFVDTVLLGYDGIAHLRRDYKIIDGRKFFELIVPAGFLEETEQVLEELRGHAHLGEIQRAGIAEVKELRDLQAELHDPAGEVIENN